MWGLLCATISLVSSFVFCLENLSFYFPSLAWDLQILWTLRLYFCILHRIIQSKGGQIHPQGLSNRVLSFVCVVVFYSILSPRSFTPFSFRFWKNHRVLELWLLLGIVARWDKLFGSLHTPSLSSSWSWSELISFWVHLRKPQQNPILLGILGLCMEFWFVHDHTSRNISLQTFC